MDDVEMPRPSSARLSTASLGRGLSSADFRLWSIAKVKNTFPPNFVQARRRALAAILLAPLSALFPKYLYAAVASRFRLSHREKQIAIHSQYGSWVLDLRHLSSKAVVTATRHAGEYRIVLNNARIRGTNCYVDLKAILGLDNGIFKFHFEQLGFIGEVNFDAWTRGAPLVLHGYKSLKFAAEWGDVEIPQPASGLLLDIDWNMSAPSAALRFPSLGNSFTAKNIQLSLPLSSKLYKQGGLIFTGGDFVINPEHPSGTPLPLGKFSHLEGCTRGGRVRLALGENGDRGSVNCNFALDSARFALTSIDPASPGAVEFDLTHALVSYHLISSGTIASVSLLGYIGAEEGLVIADGVTTLLRGDSSGSLLRFAASDSSITEFAFTAGAQVDYVPCEGVVCDAGQIERPIRVASATVDTTRNVDDRVFSVDPQTGSITRPPMPLQLHLRRKDDRVDLWVELHNLRFGFDLGGIIRPSLSKIHPREEARILFLTPPQHIGELSRVIDSASENSTPEISWRKLQPIASEPSRVAFLIPDSLLPLKFSIDELLRWDKFIPIIGPTSSDEYRNPKKKPLERISTVINLVMMSLVPVRFKIQNTDIAPRLRWLMPTTRPVPNKPNEQWHARLIDKDLRYDPAISSGVGIAVAQVEDWDWPQGTAQLCKGAEEYIRPMSARDRFELRVLTFLRKFSSGPGKPEIQRDPEPMLGSTVVLSSQGGYFLLEGSWNTKLGDDSIHLSLVRYFHLIEQGRDIEVTLVREYFMYPYGHRLVLVKQTTRRNIEALRVIDNRDSYIAENGTRFFLQVKDIEMVYSPLVQPMPWRRIRIPKEYWLTPVLDYAKEGNCVSGEYCPPRAVPKHGTKDNWRHQAFWPTVNGILFEYEFEGMDYSGRWTRFKRAVIAMENADDQFDPCSSSNKTSAVRSTPADYLSRRFADSQISFNGGVDKQLGTTDLGRIDIAVSPTFASGSTDLEVSRVSFTAKYKPRPLHRIDEDLEQREHPVPYVPTVHWVEGQFSNRVLPNATYENSEGPEGKILRWLLADPDDGVIHHPEKTDFAWILDVDPKRKPTFDLKECPLTSVPDEHRHAFKERTLYALIDRRDSAPKTKIKTTYADNTASSGVLVSPDIIIGIASRQYGASATPLLKAASANTRETLTQAQTLADYFPTDSKLCGVELLKIIAPLFNGAGEPPSFSNILNEVADGPDSIASDLSWSLRADEDPSKSQIMSFPAGVEENPFFYPGLYGEETHSGAQPLKNCSLDLKATTTSWVLGLTPPEVNTSASVRNFTVHIGWGSGSGFNGIRIPIKNMTFNSENGKKPNFGINLGVITFVGPVLEFIDQISQKLRELGATDSGWRIGIQHDGVIIDAPPIMFPDVELGAFSVENLGVYSGLVIPFFQGGGITFGFSLAKPDSRFRVTAGIWAGGGYALLELDTDHVRRFELCIEFGAAKSLRYGPVKGDVGVLGGMIYKSLLKLPFQSPGLPDTPQIQVEMEAFVRAFGIFSAWNLISLFMELYVSMTSSDGAEVTGTARFSMNTKVGFISYSYTVSHRETLSKRGDSRKSPGIEADSLASDPAVAKSKIHTDRTMDVVNEDELFSYLEAFSS